MQLSHWPTRLSGFLRRRWLALGLLTLACSSFALFGYRSVHATPAGEAIPATPVVAEVPVVGTIQPGQRTIHRVVGQPSFVESYERTSIYPKVAGYVEKWNVDIGDRVKKGQTLAIIYAPELREDWQTRKNTVRLDQEKVELDQKIVEVADADVQAAEARLTETKAILAQYQAAVERWDVQVKRLQREVERGIVDKQVLLETENQLKASAASRDAAQATIAKAAAELLSEKASLAQARIDVNVARDQVTVADSDAKRQEAWVSYLTLSAPYDGVVVARNANTGDFVLPRTGDASADHNSPHLSPDSSAAPIYVIERTDVVRIYVDVPEGDANDVHPGTRASVLVRGFRDQWIPATVTRTSWALNVKSRTLRAEIDLRNTDLPDAYRDSGTHDLAVVPSRQGAQILPGMYAYAKVYLERPKVWSLPENSLVHVGEKTFYWVYRDGNAVKEEVQTGISDGDWIEVTNRRLAAAQSSGESDWTPIDGSELVVSGDHSTLAEGVPVRLVRQTSPPATADSVALGRKVS